MPPIISVFQSASMYFNGIFNTKKIKNILLFIKNDHKYYINRPENIILQKYDMQGKKITFYYILYVYTTLLVYLLLPTIPLIIDFITSSNHSQKRNFLFELDYGMDKQQYFYYISIHSYIGTAIVANLIASCDTMYMLYAQHAYALFAIVSYELKTIHILNTNNLINIRDYHLLEKYKNIKLLPRDEKKVYRKLFICIKNHQNAIKYSNLLESLFTKSILVQLFFNVLCLSITGVETVIKLGNLNEMMRFGSFTFAQAVHIFFLCLPGQRLLNHSEEMHVSVCKVTWYIFPKEYQNLYKFLLARSLIFSKLTAFKMATLSMQTFLAVRISYCNLFEIMIRISRKYFIITYYFRLFKLQ
ncbi:odorant receptor 13a-like isoform X1 [Apis cerana]|uniref:odorant receptor 13a-like isoform X1 n=1 Tax=Apis cerana TaxID=7461 RepID=UPI002B224A9A|nr:odorant receptor 13a-like isoform X1 [Apis cerana]XP_061938211.1 odorant receptor 13a-like isoform X1 [Apis cerana]